MNLRGVSPGQPVRKRPSVYLVEQFKALELEPGNPDGSYLQRVPLVGITADPSMSLQIQRGEETLTAQYGVDFIAWSKHLTDEVNVDAELLFVGYGVQAPEFDWDDFAGVDVRGKVLLVLINDPPLEDESLFGGPAMTYYGRWTYKLEKAAELGAAGALIIHETGPAGYPWGVFGGTGARERFDLAGEDGNMGRAPLEGWVSREQAQAMLSLAGHDLDALKQTALQREFAPVPLGINAKITIKNRWRTLDSYNVVARLPGSNPELSDEHIVFMAHWDHVGIAEVDGEPQIFNGAMDNASGTTAILGLAEAFAAAPEKPERSLLFLAVTAEEEGLLGSEYYGVAPLYPLEKTLAVVNFDMANVLGPTEDLVVVGLGNSTLDDVAYAVAAETGRTLKSDPTPEAGIFYRSDHFSLAKQGVPAFYPNPGTDYIGRPAGWGAEQAQRYVEEAYHQPADTVRDHWDLSGMAKDLGFVVRMTYRIAETPEFPQWREGTEFKAKRDAMLRAAAGS
jgi:Zn-dependent M28 family amino/carboxypeptidase